LWEASAAAGGFVTIGWETGSGGKVLGEDEEFVAGEFWDHARDLSVAEMLENLAEEDDVAGG